MNAEQLKEAIARGTEQPSIEFKAPGPRTDRLLFAKVVRAILSMANRRDGGIVVLGVEERQTGLVPTGITNTDLDSWKPDHLADAIAPYADPHVEFDLQTVELDGNRFLVVEVREFSDTPVLCKKHLTLQGQVFLREGACYVRPRRKPESMEVATYADMRDLLDLATEKALRRFLQAVNGAGITLNEPAPTDADLFREQLGDLE